MATTTALRMLRPSESIAFAAHIARYIKHSGRGGAPIYYSGSPDHRLDIGGVARRTARRWTRPVGRPDWARCWAAMVGPAVVGHLVLEDQTGAGMHRAWLTMGLEPAYRRRGYGAQLIAAATEWARGQPWLSWIDLGVFSRNTPAHALYLKAGFQDIGLTPDRFRIGGQSIDVVHMALRVE